jgi:hypothetical protein
VGQIAGVCFTHVTLSVLSIIYLQLILRELFYNLSDFSNTLLEDLELSVEDIESVIIEDNEELIEGETDEENNIENND